MSYFKFFPRKGVMSRSTGGVTVAGTKADATIDGVTYDGNLLPSARCEYINTVFYGL